MNTNEIRKKAAAYEELSYQIRFLSDKVPGLSPAAAAEIKSFLNELSEQAWHRCLNDLEEINELTVYEGEPHETYSTTQEKNALYQAG